MTTVQAVEVPTTTRRTTYGQAERRREGWVWVCAYCDHVVTLGMAADVQCFDPGRWLEAIDAEHRCEHKPGKTGMQP